MLAVLIAVSSLLNGHCRHMMDTGLTPTRRVTDAVCELRVGARPLDPAT